MRCTLKILQTRGWVGGGGSDGGGNGGLMKVREGL